MRVEASDRKTFICRYRVNGIRRQYTLGRNGTITASQARLEAKRILGAAALGEDPAGDRNNNRKAIKFAELFDAYMAGHGPKLRPTSRDEYQRSITKHVLPVIGKMLAENVNVKELSKIHMSLADHPYMANRMLSHISSVISWAMDNGYITRGINPVSFIKRFREEARQRYLSQEEIKRLGETLNRAETSGLPWNIVATGASSKHIPKNCQMTVFPKHLTNAIRLLLLTGCRLREILHLRWSEVDFERGLLFLPTSKTGRKTVILNRAAISILSSMDQDGTFVVPGDFPDQPRHDLKRPWDQIQAAAGLDDVHLHDLRHTHASIGAGAGFGLPIVGRLLGHASPATTQRYAHIADDPAYRASEVIGIHIKNALNSAAG